MTAADADAKPVVAQVVDELLPAPDDDLANIHKEAVDECREPSGSTLVAYFDTDVFSGFVPSYPDTCAVISPGPLVLLRFDGVDAAAAYCNTLEESQQVFVITGSVLPFSVERLNRITAGGQVYTMASKRLPALTK